MKRPRIHFNGIIRRRKEISLYIIVICYFSVVVNEGIVISVKECKVYSSWPTRENNEGLELNFDSGNPMVSLGGYVCKQTSHIDA